MNKQTALESLAMNHPFSSHQSISNSKVAYGEDSQCIYSTTKYPVRVLLQKTITSSHF